MFVAETRISGKPEIRSELQRVRAFRPGNIVQEVVYRSLCVMAVIDALIQAIEDIPLLLCIPEESSALASETIVKRVHEARAQQRRVADHESFAVVSDGLLGRRTGKERRLRTKKILQRAAPE